MNPAAYPHAVESVEVLETHLSWVILTGEFAYKIKRPVRYPFVDQRSAAERERLCREELTLNRRFAPDLYVDVCAISLQAGAGRIGGAGPAIEHAVRMRQFSRDEELDRLLQGARIVPDEVEAFGRELSRIHESLPTASEPGGCGGPATARRIVVDNSRECVAAAHAIGRKEAVEALLPALDARLDEDQRLLDARFRAGRVRECHGDLHAANVVRRSGRLTPFDCLEFDPALRWSDVASDVAFLMADLEARDHSAFGRAFLAGYLAAGGDYELCAVLRLFKAHRALVRAKITTFGARSGPALRMFESYVEGARRSLASRAPALVVMSGLSGSGKSWMAERLAPRLGAIHLRSDVERKRLAAQSPSHRAAAGIGEGLYRREITTHLYQKLAESAGYVLAGGYPAIVDATFGRRADRARLQQCARQAGAPTYLIDCRAPPAILRERIARRLELNSDPSDADLAVLAWQTRTFEPVQLDEGWTVLAAPVQSPEVIEPLAQRLVGRSARERHDQ